MAWLFDALPALLGDPRIQVLFTLNGKGSAYEAGVADAVHEIGGRMLPWDQAVATPFDLAVTSSHYGGLDQLSSPLLILPHGAGYAKHISRPTDGAPPVPAGDKGVTVVVSSEEGLGHWRSAPELGVRVVIGGDPNFDRLRASLTERRRYRRALGVADDRRLVAVSSTWGPRSLLGTRPELPSELLAALPADEYVVAAAFHSNVWVGHGQWQLRLWMRNALDAGLRLVPYREGWRGMLVAADCLIGDHGSVTLYGATLGVPTLLSAFGGEEEIDADTAAGELGRTAPHVEASRPLREQIETVGFEHDPGRYAGVVERLFDHRGAALDRLRATVYELLDLVPPPGRAPLLTVPEPQPEVGPVTARCVVARVEDAARAARPRVEIERYPATLPEFELSKHSAGRHLAVDVTEPDRRLRESAAVVIRGACDHADDPDELQEATLWATSILDSYPGCRVVATVLAADQHCVIAFRDGPVLRVAAIGNGDVGLLASGAYAAVVAGQLEPDLATGLDISAGTLELRVAAMATLLESRPNAL